MTWGFAPYESIMMAPFALYVDVTIEIKLLATIALF